MSKKKYEKDIHPDFKSIAYNIPFNVFQMKAAKPILSVMLKATPKPKEITERQVKIRGYQGNVLNINIFEPVQTDQKLPCLLYLHGGGFGYKAAPYHKRLACIYAKRANCRVIFPDYHLLPKSPYPAAYEDVLSAYRWICRNEKGLRIDKNHIAVAGDSVGAALAATLCNSVEKKDLTIPCLQMLIYPVIDAGMRTESMKKYTDTPLWNAENNRKMWKMYLSHASKEDEKLASPMDNELPDYIPKTYIETAEIDCLHDEGILYAKKLRRHGAKVRVYDTKGTIHGYDSAVNSRITQQSIHRRIEVLQKAFHGHRS